MVILYELVDFIKVIGIKISTILSSEMGLLSDRTFLDFRMALSATVLIAVTMKSSYFSGSLKSVKK